MHTHQKIVVYICIVLSLTSKFVMNILKNIAWYVSLLLLNVYYCNALDGDSDREKRHFSNKHISVHHSFNVGHKTVHRDINIGPDGFSHDKHIVINHPKVNAHGFHQGFSHYDELDHDHSHHNNNPPIDIRLGPDVDEETSDAIAFHRNAMNSFEGAPGNNMNLDAVENI